MGIDYVVNPKISAEVFIDVLNRSTLGKRRPIDNDTCINGMLEHADILVVAMNEGQTIGAARAVSDFHYACYLSDLAVDVAYQNQGIGQMLIEKVQGQLEEGCKVILLSAPVATEYYPKVGFTKHPSAWVVS